MEVACPRLKRENVVRGSCRERKKVVVKKKLLILTVSLAVLMSAAALAQTESGNGVQGLVTSISDNVVLVEEDPATESGSKGYFTVTGETAVSRQQGGAQVPATFDELQVGQSVAATYSGPVLESYPTQGTTDSVVILEGSSGDDDLLCLLPEGCDTDGDGVPDLSAGETMPDEVNAGFEQYNAA